MLVDLLIDVLFDCNCFKLFCMLLLILAFISFVDDNFVGTVGTVVDVVLLSCIVLCWFVFIDFVIFNVSSIYNCLLVSYLLYVYNMLVVCYLFYIVLYCVILCW